MRSQDFLAAVLPSSGVYCAVEISTPKREHFFTTSVDEVYAKAMEFSEKGYNAFYALASFDDSKKRLAENAVKMRSLFLDIDCGEGKDYPNKQAAAAALDTFLSTTSLAELGTPWIVSSGGGIHVYWPFTEEVDIDVWKPVAENLKRLAKKEGFNIDFGVTADASRILRVPDTNNYKQAKPRKVKIMVEASPQQFDFETVKNILKEKLNGSAYELVPRQTVDIPGVPLSATNNGVKLMENTVNKLSLIEEKCGQFKHYKEHASDDGMEPLWYAMISVAKKCEDGWERMQELSAMHPYDESRLVTKWNQTKGHSPCIKFDSVNPGICQNCPKWQKITTPLQLGSEIKTVEEAQEIIIPQAEPEAPQVILSKPVPPKGFSYGEKGGVFVTKVIEDADGGKETKNVMLLSYDLFVVDILKENDEHFVHLAAIRPLGVVDIMLPQKAIISKDETLKTLASQNVIAAYGSGNDKNLFEYVRACVEYASTNKNPVKVPANYGWQADNTFVYNNQVYHPDGSKVFVPMPGLANINHVCKPAGTIDEWRKTINMFIAREFWDIITMGLIGPASLLMEFTGINGMTYHMGSSESGTGKSLAQSMAASFFAEPELYRVSQSTSPVAIQQRAGLLRNFPIITDEVTTKSREDFEWFPAYVMDKSQGKGKERMESGANKERLNTTIWRSMDLFSSNTHVTDYLGGTRKHSSTAELLRVLEMKLTLVLKLNEDETTLIKALNKNYGVAGEQLIMWMVANLDIVKQVLESTTAALKEEFGSTSEERFWTAGNSCIVAMTILLGKKYANIIDIPVRPVIESLRKLVENSRLIIHGNKRTAEDVLNAYTRDNYSKFVIIRNKDGSWAATLGGLTGVDDSITRSQVAGRVEHDMTPGHVDYFIEEQQLKAHCVTMSFGYADFKKQLESTPTYKIKYMKKDMLAKTRGPTMRVNVMQITRPITLEEQDDS